MKELHQHYIDGVLQRESMLEFSEADGLQTVIHYIRKDGEWTPVAKHENRNEGGRLVFCRNYAFEGGQWLLYSEIRCKRDHLQRNVQTDSFSLYTDGPYTRDITTYDGDLATTRHFWSAKPEGPFVEENYFSVKRTVENGPVKDIYTYADYSGRLIEESHVRKEYDPSTGKLVALMDLDGEQHVSNCHRYTYSDGLLVRIRHSDEAGPKTDIHSEYEDRREVKRTKHNLREGSVEITVTTRLTD